MSQDQPRGSRALQPDDTQPDETQPDGRLRPEPVRAEERHDVGRLQLELRRVRSRATAARLEATVARLEARAAELQWLIDRATGQPPQTEPPQQTPPPESPRAASPPAETTPAQTPAEPPAAENTATENTVAENTATRLDSWEPLAAAARRRRRAAPAQGNEIPQSQHAPRASAPPQAAAARPANPAGGQTARHRSSTRTSRPTKRSPLPSPPANLPPVSQAPGPAPRQTRKKPAAWIVSMAIHVAALLLLGGLTLSVQRPQDQIAFTASAAPSREPQSLQTLQIESPIEATDTNRSETTERPVELNPLAAVPLPPPGELPSLPSEVAAAAVPPLDNLLEPNDMLAALTTDHQSTTRFCGVEGGGNHFVYIVDSSQSMKNGRFDSARRELLQAIDSLQPQQRFYIIFYDIHLDRMCVSHPTQPDQFSVLATDENKRRARRWAMSVQLEQGAPPDKALSFALDLRPDVIFLLSDGEFPQRIEDLMAQRNRIHNLFGDAGPISILHTIGYHSRDGETRMRRLAAANGGQYRYIPAP